MSPGSLPLGPLGTAGASSLPGALKALAQVYRLKLPDLLVAIGENQVIQAK